MEIIFSYIAGQGSAVIEAVDHMNEQRELLMRTNYSTSIERLALIFVVSILSEDEKKGGKMKLARFDNRLALNFYLEEGVLRGITLHEKISLLKSLVINTLLGNSKIKKQPIDINSLISNLNLIS